MMNQVTSDKDGGNSILHQVTSDNDGGNSILHQVTSDNDGGNNSAHVTIGTVTRVDTKLCCWLVHIPKSHGPIENN